MAASKSKTPKTFAPSLAGRCLRYTVMDLLGFGRSLNQETLAAMHAGTAWHKIFRTQLARDSNVLALERPLKDGDLGIFGRIDAVIIQEGRTVAVEYKTVHDERFREIGHYGPVFEHWAQLALYVNFGGYDYGRLIVDNRDTHERLTWLVFPNALWKSWIIRRIRMAQDYQQRRSLPPREISVRCLQCDRWQRCFKTAEERDQRVTEHPQWEPEPPFPEPFVLIGAYLPLDQQAGDAT